MGFNDFAEKTEKVIIKHFKLALIILILLFYRKMFWGYFQGDEWYVFEKFLPDTDTLVGFIYNVIVKPITHSYGNHLIPLSRVLFSLSEKLFGFNYFPWALSALLIHIANSFLLHQLLKKFTQEKIVTIPSTLFFALSSIHQQAVTWMANHLITALSVTFILLAVNKFVEIVMRKSVRLKEKILLGIYIICALLTKESAIIIFPLLALTTYFLKKSRFKISAVCNFLGLACYSTVRFLMQAFTQNENTSSEFDVPLIIFRIFTYPVRALAQVFVPNKATMWLSEKLTVLAYPIYAAEAEVRGTNYLTFVQGAGSDIFIFLFALLLSFVFLVLVHYQRKNERLRNILFIGMFILATSAVPLVAVAINFPWWGYVTHLDSRHLYLPSVGGAMLFGVLTLSLTKHLPKFSKTAYGNETTRNLFNLFNVKHTNLPTKQSVFLTIISLWIIPNYLLLQKELEMQKIAGQDRKKVINSVLAEAPKLKDQQIIYVDSDSSYYGFADLMPPFQTNFGQVLSVIYYRESQLPNEFLDTDYLTKGGLAGQGYKEIGNRGFGYFLSLPKLTEAVHENNLSAENVIAISWDGKNHSMSSATEEIREKLREILKTLSFYDGWNEHEISEFNLAFKTPPDSSLTSQKIKNRDILYSYNYSLANGDSANMIIRKRTGGLGIFQDVSLLSDFDGNEIGENFYLRNIKAVNGSEYVAKVTSTGKAVKYFLPTIISEHIIEITDYKTPSRLSAVFEEIEEFISLIKIKEI